MNVLGIDEAGRGPVIGPMVMAGVLSSEPDRFKVMGVKDSKLHSQREREQLFDKIQVAADAYEILICNPPEIDAALNDPKMNLNWLEAEKIIELIMKFKPDKVIADCPSTNTSAFIKYIQRKLDYEPELVIEHKADENYPVCSAASILAKVTRDNAVKTLRDIYGDFGSGYLTDPKTQEFLNNDHSLPIFRKSWVSWKRVEDKKRQRTLGDF